MAPKEPKLYRKSVRLRNLIDIRSDVRIAKNNIEKGEGVRMETDEYQEKINQRKIEINSLYISQTLGNVVKKESAIDNKNMEELRLFAQKKIVGKWFVNTVFIITVLLVLFELIIDTLSPKKIDLMKNKVEITRKNDEFMSDLANKLAPLQIKSDTIISVKRPTLESPNSGVVKWQNLTSTSSSSMRFAKKCTTPLMLNTETEIYFLRRAEEKCV